MTATPTPPLNDFERLWLTEAIRLREEQAGALEDTEACRKARAAGGDAGQLIGQRALWLARRDGLDTALQHWRQGTRLAALLLAGLAVLAGAGMGVAALGDGQRPVNIFWALGSLLGLNLVLLLVWFLAPRFAREGGSLLGRLWLWLSEKLARDAHALQLGPALLAILQENRLTRWLTGTALHGLWLVTMGSALLTLLALLATHRYSFVWETTILSDSVFIGLTQLLGLLPGLLGLDPPSVSQIQASGGAWLSGPLPESTRQAWASWMVGVVLVYGLLPRLLLMLLCSWRWRRGRAALRLDLQRPGYALLRSRLQAAERLGVTDPAPEQLHTPDYGHTAVAGAGAVLVAIELDSSQPWPPLLPAGVADAGILDDRRQRKALLEQLTVQPPARLVIACDPRRSIDRGTLALIGELARCATAARVWLLPAPAGEQLDADRLGDWHEALGRMGVTFGEQNPLAWLEQGDD